MTSNPDKTLRDEFAMAAPISLEEALNAAPEGKGKDTWKAVFNRLAKMRYTYADAMLAERMK